VWIDADQQFTFASMVAKIPLNKAVKRKPIKDNEEMSLINYFFRSIRNVGLEENPAIISMDFAKQEDAMASLAEARRD